VQRTIKCLKGWWRMIEQGRRARDHRPSQKLGQARKQLGPFQLREIVQGGTS
jgi:hypothetical protein